MTASGSPTFWNLFAPLYLRQKVADEASYRRKLSETQARLSPQDRVLELGCGTGTTALAHAPHVAEIVATDFSPGMIAQAERQKRKGRVKNVTFQVASAESLSHPPESFDAVLALNLLHLVDDPGAILKDIARVLRPGGFLAASTMAMSDRLGFLRPLAWALPVTTNFFTEAAHKADIAAAGLEIELDWTPSARAATFIIARKPAS